ncbi:MAG TPA: Hsp20/alpha crystallin family protein [Steroidobacteraceae bacterium]|jgi:HSP20 family protein|nr:Hsp20/alpha crystallin family protein [Steroidobacteraceae bacterium]
MALVRYEPWAAMSRLQNEINRVFGNFNTGNESDSATAEWSPAVDVREYADRFELLVDLPGVETKEVEITLDAGVLTLSGDRREEQLAEAGQVQHTRVERPTGRFHRRFILPETADTEHVKANGKNGVLSIAIRKQAKAQPRRISIG